MEQKAITIRAVVGVFGNHLAAADTVHALEAQGLPSDQIGYIMSDAEGKIVAVGHENTGTTNQKAAAAGMVEVGMIGGVLGAAVGALIPGFRSVLGWRRSCLLLRRGGWPGPLVGANSRRG